MGTLRKFWRSLTKSTTYFVCFWERGEFWAVDIKAADERVYGLAAKNGLPPKEVKR